MKEYQIVGKGSGKFTVQQKNYFFWYTFGELPSLNSFSYNDKIFHSYSEAEDFIKMQVENFLPAPWEDIEKILQNDRQRRN